ncbi:MAG TPA: hypothetical protein VIK91_19140, partial [Nannocystis sp.]
MRPLAPAVLVSLCTAAVACGDSSGTGSASASAGTSATAATTATTGSTGDTPTTGSGGGTDGSDTEPTTTDTTAGGPKLDVGAPDGMGACGCEFKYVWVANSVESTVSKINMETLVEEARYLTRPDGK